MFQTCVGCSFFFFLWILNFFLSLKRDSPFMFLSVCPDSERKKNCENKLILPAQDCCITEINCSFMERQISTCFQGPVKLIIRKNIMCAVTKRCLNVWFNTQTTCWWKDRWRIHVQFASSSWLCSEISGSGGEVSSWRPTTLPHRVWVSGQSAFFRSAGYTTTLLWKCQQNTKPGKRSHLGHFYKLL